jgi:hypothetical protein
MTEGPGGNKSAVVMATLFFIAISEALMIWGEDNTN